MNRQRAKVRWNGDRDTWYGICLGPILLERPPMREFHGGDETILEMTPTENKPGHSDLYFEDGEFAIEVGHEYYEIIEVLG